MHQKTFIASLVIAIGQAQAEFQKIQVKVDWVKTDLYVHTPDWSVDGVDVAEDHKSVSFGHNKRMYLSKSPTTDPSQYFSPDMLGGKLSYKVDLSNVGCGCVTAFYGVSMPAVDNLDDPFGYCGSGSSAAAACPEHDHMEANKHGFRSTSHRCQSPNEDGIYTDCDQQGSCTVDVLRQERNGVIQEKLYGPGPDYKIDTTMPFIVQHEYQAGGWDKFTAFTTSLWQQGKGTVTMTDGDCPYLQASSWPVREGMAFVMSNWSPSNLDWIQHGTCEGQCDTENVLSVFSDIHFKTSGARDAPVDYNDYKFGAECNQWRLDNAENKCDPTCDECRWSWPIEDPTQWQSDHAACRCMPKQRAPQGYTYSAAPCSDINVETGLALCDNCGDDVGSCHFSHPSDDPLKFLSSEAMCRCKPVDLDEEISYGGDCGSLYTGLCGADCSSCKWSWPTSDPAKWASEKANCRCAAEDIKEIKFGGECEKRNYGLCGSYCDDCRWSWEDSDEEKWAGESANCRCKEWWGA